MLIAVDGTGPDSDADYYRDLGNSFVRQIYQQNYHADTHYFRGPTLAGFESKGIADRAFEKIRNSYNRQQSSTIQLHLTGYSRGGAIVIAVAKMLKRELPQVKIESMSLFDAVNRSTLGVEMFSDIDTIPGNVKVVYHAMRRWGTPSRIYFGNCGVRAKSPTKFIESRYYCTHAGMGGMPWGGDKPPFMDEQNDILKSQMVKSWMWDKLRNVGLL
jgi:hypothetical protein